MRFDTRHWHVPDPRNPNAGVVEGKPTDEQRRAAVMRLQKARDEWQPGPEAFSQLAELHGYIGQHVRIQFWSPIMYMLEEEGPNPLYAKCVGISTGEHEGHLRPCLVLANVRELVTKEGSSGLDYLTQGADYMLPMAPVADLYEVEVVAESAYEDATRAATPRQNRVTPAGEIIRDSARGALMGNRGSLHSDDGQLVRQHIPSQHRWIACTLKSNGIRRTLMAPGQYTELFFLDEATSLAAGHRPCSSCRNKRYRAFVAAWRRGNPDSVIDGTGQADAIDYQIARDRLTESGEKRTYLARLEDLPDGTFVLWPPEDGLADSERRLPTMVQGDTIRKWRPQGFTSYGRARRAGIMVRVLTPHSIVNTLKAGYQPEGLPGAPATVLKSEGHSFPSNEASVAIAMGGDDEATTDRLLLMLDGP